MADASVQVKVQKWVAEVWLAELVGQPCKRDRVKLSSGGTHSFAAVSADRTIIANIHTSGATTAAGKLAVGKLTKVRADIFFLMLATADRKLSIFTDRNMLTLVSKERAEGRMPHDIEFHHVDDLPNDLSRDLRAAQSEASAEMLA